jgi:GH15 family glucan-1,4-alpha-glucosidase
MDLYQRSIDVILSNQSVEGAYVASPTFSQYGFSWLRDGMWIAHAMDTVGEHESASAFHAWAARTIVRYEGKISGLVKKVNEGEPIAETDYLPTRFTVGGGIDAEEWPNFQLDGYGAWLWGFVNHCKTFNEDLWLQAVQAVRLLINYLGALWQSPNYDCWEEFRQERHLSTFAALYGGLSAVHDYCPHLISDDLLRQIREYALNHGVANDGHFQKFLDNDAVDASLLWLAVPFNMVSADDPRFRATVEKVERDLVSPDGGVYRYRDDVYFGGGEWLLLTAWLAWTYIELGRIDEAQSLVTWIERQARPNGDMPEQVQNHLLHPHTYDEWVERWGESASPLLWSHAMYLIVIEKLKAHAA